MKDEIERLRADLREAQGGAACNLKEALRIGRAFDAACEYLDSQGEPPSPARDWADWFLVWVWADNEPTFVL